MISFRNGFSGDAAHKIDALCKSLAMIEFDTKGVILAANANFCKALGYEEREIVGKHHSLFVEPEYAASQAYRDFWTQLARGQFDAREYLRLGKGVAQEVRALAQRSADAAKEIKVLIANSSAQVERGVKLVGDTGQALRTIVNKVSEIDTLISEIAQSSREQATGLGEVNVAVNQMDQVTQQNAGMVEEATAAAASLRQEADELDHLIARFNVTARAAARSRRAA